MAAPRMQVFTSGQRLRPGLVRMKRPAMMRKATKKPAPESAANTGLTWALWVFVRSGRVDGGTGIRPPIGAMVVDVVVVVGAGVVGTVG